MIKMFHFHNSIHFIYSLYLKKFCLKLEEVICMFFLYVKHVSTAAHYALQNVIVFFSISILAKNIVISDIFTLTLIRLYTNILS